MIAEFMESFPRRVGEGQLFKEQNSQAAIYEIGKNWYLLRSIALVGEKQPKLSFTNYHNINRYSPKSPTW